MHLLIFSDGTWNTPDQMDGGLPAPTNVVKLRNAVAPLARDGSRQRVYYHTGVGTEGGWWSRIAGGGLGHGLDRNIMSAYAWACRTYQPGAKIWLFGFSRGAYTVRSLGGMIARCGLLDPQASELTSEKAFWDAVEDLFNIYRQPADKAPPVVASDELHFHDRSQGQATKESIPIHFIGVWDTVGALGVPDDMALLDLLDDPRRHEFHDTTLSPIVKNARHALAIDERRQSFTPTLWTGVEDKPDVKQIWFPGVHGDVGGGYGRSGLSDNALAWMMDEAEDCGLGLRADVKAQLAPDPQGQLHDSLTGIFESLKTRPRQVPRIEKDGALLHSSAWERQETPSVLQGDYWKTTVLGPQESEEVDVFARPHWNSTGLYLEAGTPYDLTATGEWLDSSIRSDPGGTKDGKFYPGEIAQVASSGLGKLESLYKRLTGNRQADFWLTRREEDLDWFVLVGLVANGVHVPPNAKKVPDFPRHEVFRIGKGARFTPSRGGYLYAFANDAWQLYFNNAGSVRMRVTRP
ncbi:DUF2235 domain-containing protein [Rhizobium sp. CSW-27]|uniref:DUF2235 domain-containing protein n=1 Tax=Rhizobium sp. CSW-27 TaxID=2839985 RepID=UPI001C02B151|nr:DUF2235 domain-containing protein [Rhizobium sp. CSW-27]MBT9373279.1 DUF2235 domain-containing protein [Rhizobium sp. CSW-27]